MAYTVDWVARIVTIPTSDLTLVSGTRYKLDMADFLAEIRRLESDPTEGLWAPQIVEHTNTKFDFAGVDYAPFDEIINGYTWKVTGAATRVDLVGSNNNLIDALISTGVSVVPSNSAGLIKVAVGGADAAEVATAVWAHPTAVTLEDRVSMAHTILRNKTVTDPITGIMTIYAEDGVTPVMTAQLYENAGGSQSYRGQGAERRERLE